VSAEVVRLAWAGKLLSVRNLAVEYRSGDGRRREIVTGLDLDVAQGETIGIVGESGSGKSLSARAMMRLLPPGVHASGSILYRGTDLFKLSERQMARVRGSNIAMLLQDPFTMLNPLLRSGLHIEEGLREREGARLSGRARRADAARRLAEVGITDPDVLDRYPFQLSGGMRQRVALAAALAQDPDVLIADEPSTALDVTTQAEILQLLKDVQASRGMGLVLITHDLRVAFSVCDRIHVLYAGSLLEAGPAHALESEPLHPYSLGLLLSEPAADRRQAELTAIEGSVPSPAEVAATCSFAPRCRWATDRCVAAKPPLHEAEPGRLTACIRLEEIRGEMAAMREAARVRLPPAVAAQAARDPLVRIADLRKTFRDRSGRDVHAVAGVSIEIGRNESVGLVGESGSGKTTLGRCLVGLEHPTSGSVLIDGIDAGDLGKLSREDRGKVRRTVQIVFQDPYSSLDPMQTVGSSLREILSVNGYPKDAAPERIEQLLTYVGLPLGYAGRRPAALSGGERQRVAIARTLAVGPELIVCDEPVSALDVSVQAQILNLFRSLKDELGLSYLFITHDLAVVRQVVDRVYVMYRGEIVEHGPVDDVLDNAQHEYTARLIASIPKSAVG
jgi:peptide/nickel transport system ATP-binding protein